MLDGDRQIQAQPADERERVRRVDGQRRQHREHLLVEVGRQPPAFGVVEFGPRDDQDAFVGQRRPHRVEEHVRMPAGDLLGALADPAQLFARRQPVGRAHRQPHLVAAFEPGDPHHVELVEVGREDRQELGPLQQRQRGVGGQRQHAGVEVQPAQLAVEVAILGQRRRRPRATSPQVAPPARSRSRACRPAVAVATVGFVGRIWASVILSDDSLSDACVLLRETGEPTSLVTSARWPAWSPGRHRGRRAAIEIVRGVDVAAQSGPGAGQFDGARIAMALSGIRAELRIERHAEGEQRRCAGAVPVGDEAARVTARAAAIASASSCGLQCRQITLQRNDIATSASRIAASAARDARCSAGRGGRRVSGRPAPARRVGGRPRRRRRRG